MKKLLMPLILFAAATSFAQTRVNPVIKNYGGIFEIPYAEEKPDPNLTYNIIVEVEKPSEKPDTINWALHNVARLVNLHVMAGVKPEKLNVVVAIHGGAAFIVMDNKAYREKYKVDNPNLGLFDELDKAGVKMVVCGQSLLARNIDRHRMTSRVKIASSMLTTMTTYELKGYAALKF